jgi:hypothetical protein
MSEFNFGQIGYDYGKRPNRAEICFLGDIGDQSLRTGPNPGVDNAGLLADAFARGRPADRYVLPTNGDMLNYGQLTYFDRRPPAVPRMNSLWGAGDHKSASGVVRCYHAQDWREPFITLNSESMIKGFTAYIMEGFMSGAPFGMITRPDEFCIHPYIEDMSCTNLGNASWATGLSLDAGDGVYELGGRGVRDARIRGLTLWAFYYRGVHLEGFLGGSIEASTLTADFGHPDALCFYLGGNDKNPSYSNTIFGDYGSMYIEHAHANTIVGQVTEVHFGEGSYNNKIICPTKLSKLPTVDGKGSGNIVEHGGEIWKDPRG